MMVVLVSTADPGLEIFPTHRLFRGHEDAIPASPGGPVTEALAGLVTASLRPRLALSRYRGGEAFPVLGEPGELDVELVERLIGHDGVGYTARRGRCRRAGRRR